MVNRAGQSVQVPQSASQEVRNAFQALETTFVKTFPGQPIRLPQFLYSDLPSASDYPFSLIAVTDRGIAYSNGSVWLKTDGSAL